MPEFFAGMMGVLAFWPQMDLVAALGDAPEVAFGLYTEEEVQQNQSRQTSISDFFTLVNPLVQSTHDPRRCLTRQKFWEAFL